MVAVETVKRTLNEEKVTPRKVTSKVTLPTEKNVPPMRLDDSIIVIYGRKGVGKTSLAANFDNALVAMFERGRRNLPIMQFPQEGEPKLDWATFKAYMEAFLESDFATLVIDTVDKAYECCLDWVCQQNNCSHPNDKNDYGKTWGLVKREFDETLGRIHESGKGLILISHETTKTLSKTSKGLKRESGPEPSTLERFEPSCSKQAFEVIQEICDYVFYYGYRDEHRCITVRSPNDLVWTSCGFSTTFLDPDGVPIWSFRAGNSPEEAYANLIAAHANEVRDFDYVEPREKPLIKRKEN